MTTISKGLEGIAIAETRISDVDGQKGVLILGGHRVEDLAGRVTFEDVCALMWDGALPTDQGREVLRKDLGQSRAMAFERLSQLGDALSLPDGMDALRASVGHLASEGTERDVAVRLTGAMAVFATSWARKKQGQAPVRPEGSVEGSVSDGVFGGKSQ